VYHNTIIWYDIVLYEWMDIVGHVRWLGGIVGVYTVMVCRWTDHILARNPLLEVEVDLS
jgi:hypothetical protein